MYVHAAPSSDQGAAVTSIDELPEEIRGLYPSEIRDLYEIHEWRNATVVLKGVHPQEWNDLIEVLRAFRLLRSDLIKGGGNKSRIATKLDGHLFQLGWMEKQFDTRITVDETVYETPTHKVDCFKNRVACEIEWNNKDPFFDRDLNNFRLLFELRAIDLGIIITRTDELQGLVNELGRRSSFGQSTTHMSKLLPKIDGGGAGGCPVLVFGIRRSLYVKDDSPLSPRELQEAELLEAAAAIQELEDET